MSKKVSASDLEGFAAEVQLLKDKAEIRATLDRYWFGEDRCDPGIVASAFTEDAHYGTMHGHDDIRKVMKGLEAYDSMQHCFASSNIDIDGDNATADTMAVGFNVGPNDNGEQRVLVRGLRYIDELVRTDDGWVIKRRRGHDEPEHGHDTFWQFEGVTTEVWHPKARP
ncbi:MAG: nuclear transport factor 2 family protein [Acidimicrobiales bacterium]|nr:nuclear transport factor 2 family protein [Acidimicrobiales bacterium]